MSHDHGRECVCRAEHVPHPMELEKHHVWPLGMGGPNEEWNFVWVCPTTHTNTHEILRELVKRRGLMSFYEACAHWTEPLTRYAFNLATLGYQRWAANQV